MCPSVPSPGPLCQTLPRTLSSGYCSSTRPPASAQTRPSVTPGWPPWLPAPPWKICIDPFLRTSDSGRPGAHLDVPAPTAMPKHGVAGKPWRVTPSTGRRRSRGAPVVCSRNIRHTARLTEEQSSCLGSVCKAVTNLREAKMSPI